MDIPCSVVFFENFNSTNQIGSKRIPNFYAEGSISSETPIQLRENTTLQLEFLGNPEDRIYISGIENCRGLQVEEDEDGVYLRARNQPYVLFDGREYDVYPFVPELLIIRVVTHTGVVWDADVKVTSKLMNEDEYVFLTNEVYNFLGAQTKDPEIKRLAQEMLLVKPSEFENLNIYRSRFLHVLQELSKGVRYEFQRQRSLDVLKTRSSTTLYTQPSVKKKTKINFTSDTNENRWLKFFLIQLLKTYRQNLLSEDRTNGTILYFLQYILSLPFMKEIKYERKFPIPRVFFSAGPYSFVYEFYRLVNKKQLLLQNQWMIQSRYKSTSKLFEIWGLICLIKSVERLGFKQKVSSFKECIEKDRLQGLYYVFSRNNMNIRISYDQTITSFPDKLSMESPVFTKGHDKPDIRLDIEIDGYYTGSLVIDCKYQLKSNIWRNGDFNKPNTMRQLIHYSQLLGSNSSILNGIPHEIIDRAPVIETWVYFPNFEGDVACINELKEYSIRFVPCKPNLSGNEMDKYLEKIIEKAKVRSIRMLQETLLDGIY